MQSDVDLAEVLDVCRDLALKGGEVAMEYYDQADTIRIKSDLSPITAADVAVDEIIFQGLSNQFPTIPLVSEERLESQTLEIVPRLYFLVDPIDGTKEFISRNGEFTVNVALIEDNIPVLGVVFAPAMDQLFFGSKYIGSFESHPKQNKAFKVSAQKLSAIPSEGPLLKMMISRSHLDSQTIEFIRSNPNSERIIAGSSLKFCELAAGRADIYPRFGQTMEWDTAAGHAILLSAGGRVEDLDGLPLSYGKREFRNSAFIAHCEGVEFALSKRF